MSGRIVFLAALMWAIAAFAGSARTFVTEGDEELIYLRHDIRHAIAESTEWGGDEALAYFENHAYALNRTALWHAGTAVFLGGIGIWGLARRRTSTNRSANNALEQTREG